MKAARGNPLGVYVIIVVVAEAGLLSAAALTSGVEGTVLIVGMVLILALVVVFVGKSRALQAAPPQEVKDVWSAEDLPIPAVLAEDWKCSWNCRWTYRGSDGEFYPYVDDFISIGDVDPATGFVSARGRASYEPGVEYKVSGRMSKHGLGVFFYSSAGTKLAGLDGTFILRRSPVGEVEGWWMGNARTMGEVERQVTFEKSQPGDGFQTKVYDYPNPKDPLAKL